MNNKTISCPIDTLDFERINLGHGSGGLQANRLLDGGVFSIFQNEKIQKRHDGAILELDGKIAFSTDSFVVSPLFFPGGNIGDLAVNGTINDLAMCGARPKYLSLGFILEEGFPIDQFSRILSSIKSATDEAGVEVVTGDTKVVEKGHGDGIFINTTGIGLVHPDADIDHVNIREGDAIILSGPMAAHGITIMAQREGLDITSSIQSDTCYLGKTIESLLDEFGADLHLLRDPTRGGVASTLNEVCKQLTLGIDIYESGFRVDEQVTGLCELLGLDPLYVANEGIFVAFVDHSIADDFLRKLQDLPFGKDSAIIGRTVLDHPGKVILHSRIGGQRVVKMLPGDQLPRIC